MPIRYSWKSIVILVILMILILSGCNSSLDGDIQSLSPTNLPTGVRFGNSPTTIKTTLMSSNTPPPVTITLPGLTETPENLLTPIIVTPTPSPATATLPGQTITPDNILTPTIVTPTTSINNKFEILTPVWFIFTDEKTKPSDDVIYLRTDGKKIRKTSGISTYPTKYIFPRDGQMMAFVSDPRSAVIVLTRPDFSSLKRVGKDPDLKHFGSWSPDGNTIVFTQYDNSKDWPAVDLFTLDIRTGNIQQLTNTPEIAEHNAVYSPDGAKIAFIEIQFPAHENTYLMVMDAGGNNRRKVLDEIVNSSDISWSPDGKKLVFAMGEECSDLYTVNENGSGLMQLTNMPGNEYNPVWSPDGKWISFVATKQCGKDRGWKIYTITPEGNGLAEIKNSYNNLSFHPVIFPLPALQAGKSFTITESGDGLNLRQSPSLSGEVIQKLKEGDEIQVLDGPVEADENLWWRVRLEGSNEEGWVAEIPGWFSGEW